MGDRIYTEKNLGAHVHGLHDVEILLGGCGSNIYSIVKDHREGSDGWLREQRPGLKLVPSNYEIRGSGHVSLLCTGISFDLWLASWK